MKKRLLISSVLMSAVLACALGTGTYAWYEATTKGEASVTSSSADISTKANNYSVDGVTFALTLTNSGAPDLVDSNGDTYFWTTEAHDISSPKLEVENNTKYGTLTLSVLADTTDTNVLANAEGEYTITITDNCATNDVVYSKETNPYAGSQGSITAKLTVEADGTYELDCTTFYYSIMAKTNAVDGVLSFDITAAVVE